MVVGKKDSRRIVETALLLILPFFSGCSSAFFEVLNPYDVTPERELGERTNKPLLGESGNHSEIDYARHAFIAMTTSHGARAPQPTYPVKLEPEVRLMWIPDHVNQFNDLVPSHYYFLKVLNARWAVQDGVELQEQVNQAGASGAGTITPFVYGKPRQ